MIEKMIDGNKYWCCSPSVESVGYGDDGPVKPWQGILITHPGRTTHILNRFGENDIIDNDPNAYAIVKVTDLFQTEEEATKHYRKLVCEYADRLSETLSQGNNVPLPLGSDSTNFVKLTFHHNNYESELYVRKHPDGKHYYVSNSMGLMLKRDFDTIEESIVWAVKIARQF